MKVEMAKVSKMSRTSRQVTEDVVHCGHIETSEN